MIDIYHSRRTHFRKCSYWLPVQTNEIDKWILENKPEGSFYASEVNMKTNQGNQINNVIMYDRNMVTLVTNDEVDNISRGCIVLYLNHSWLVENVQRETHIQESEFGGEHYTTYISISR